MLGGSLHVCVGVCVSVGLTGLPCNIAELTWDVDTNGCNEGTMYRMGAQTPDGKGHF